MVALTKPGLNAWLSSSMGISLERLLLLAVGTFVLYTLVVYVYNAYFHPLSKYPGPKLAAISDLWSAYFLCGGRWPWILEDVLQTYGDVVRIGPNSVVFLDPQAVLDIHGPKRDLSTTFTKTSMVEGLGDEDDGLLWERDPEKHRRVSKMMSPAFSGNSLREKLPVMNRHIDTMITKMLEHGAGDRGIDLSRWIEWLCMDVAADLAYSWEMNQVRDSTALTLNSAFDVEANQAT
ncbi:hypothetical protein S40288_07736 [Stachybotrys chartarum IBT 40288]|nr:hypothetical protein S40288_07736 [Stachybotrys chartarum IBT 40288]